jgi:hypothetical protein
MSECSCLCAIDARRDAGANGTRSTPAGHLHDGALGVADDERAHDRQLEPRESAPKASAVDSMTARDQSTGATLPVPPQASAVMG